MLTINLNFIVSHLLCFCVGLALLASPLPVFAQAQDESSIQFDLEDVLALVKSRNEEWQISAQQIQRSQALQREALAALLPQLALSASGTRHGGDEVFVGDRAVRQRYEWGGALTSSVMLFDGQRYPQYTRAGELVELTRAEASWRRISTLLDAETSFYTLAAAQQDEQIAHQTVELRQAYLTQAEAMQQAGLGIALDVSRARAQLLEAEHNLLNARANVGNAADALAVLIGYEPDQPIRTTASASQPHAPPARFSARSFEQREDIRAQQLGIRAAELSKKAVWWSLLPSLQLQTGARVGPPSFANPDGFAWSISLTLSWLLYDGGARYARIKGLDAEIEERKLSLTRYQRRSNAELSQALRSWTSSYDAIAVAEQQVDVARQSYDTALGRFEAGLATSIDVVDASQQLFRAQILLNQAKLRANLASARYRYLEALEPYGQGYVEIDE